MNWTITRQQQELEQASLKQGWQQLTTIAVEHMELARVDGKSVWMCDTVEEARAQARRLAAAQWQFHTRRFGTGDCAADRAA